MVARSGAGILLPGGLATIPASGISPGFYGAVPFKPLLTGLMDRGVRVTVPYRKPNDGSGTTMPSQNPVTKYDNRWQPTSSAVGPFTGVVINVDVRDLFPNGNSATGACGALVRGTGVKNYIDDYLYDYVSGPSAWNVAHPDRPVRALVRLYVGWRAPAWWKTYAGTVDWLDPGAVQDGQATLANGTKNLTAFSPVGGSASLSTTDNIGDKLIIASDAAFTSVVQTTTITATSTTAGQLGANFVGTNGTYYVRVVRGLPIWWDAGSGNKNLVAYQNVLTALAAAYDTEDAIAGFTVSGCHTQFPEPYQRGYPDATDAVAGAFNWPILDAAGLTGQKDADAIYASALCHRVFKRSRAYLSFNTFQKFRAASEGGNNSAPGTSRYTLDLTTPIAHMDALVDVFGQQIVLCNNSARTSFFRNGNLKVIYDRMAYHCKNSGIPIHWQTATAANLATDRAGWVSTLNACIADGATSVEVTNDFYKSSPTLTPQMDCATASSTLTFPTPPSNATAGGCRLDAGQPVQIKALSGVTGVTVGNWYWITNPTYGTAQLASSLANALAGTAITLTGTGTVSIVANSAGLTDDATSTGTITLITAKSVALAANPQVLVAPGDRVLGIGFDSTGRAYICYVVRIQLAQDQVSGLTSALTNRMPNILRDVYVAGSTTTLAAGDHLHVDASAANGVAYLPVGAEDGAVVAVTAAKVGAGKNVVIAPGGLDSIEGTGIVTTQLTPAFVRAQPGNGTTAATATWTAPTVGDLLVANVWQSHGILDVDPPPAPTMPAGWTLRSSVIFGQSAAFEWWKIADGTETSVTATADTSDGAQQPTAVRLTLTEYTNCSGPAYGAIGPTDNGGRTATSMALSTDPGIVVTGDLVHEVAAFNSAVTTPLAFTSATTGLDNGNVHRLLTGYRLAAADGVQTDTVTWSTSVTAGGFISGYSATVIAGFVTQRYAGATTLLRYDKSAATWCVLAHLPAMPKRVQTLTDAATVTIDADNHDAAKLLTLSQATLIANPTGTPTAFQDLELRIKSTTTRALTWGAKFRGGTDVALPSATTGSSKTDYMRFSYNADDDKWDIRHKAMGY